MESTRNKAEIIADLEVLAHEPGFIYSLAFILSKDFFYGPDEAADINWRERISFQEATFLTGLMIKREIDYAIFPTPQQSAEQIKKVYELFKELHDTHLFSFFDGLNPEELKNKSHEELEQSFRGHFGKGEHMTEPIFYGGSGAYDFQYWKLAPRKYQNDENWITKNHGISVKVAADITIALKDLGTEKYRSSPDEMSENFQDLCKIALRTFAFSPAELPAFPTETLNNFLKAFSLKPGTVNESLESTGGYNALSSHPIIFLDVNLYFLPISFLLAESLYESPFYWMNNDTPYKQTAAKNRGDATELIAFEMLEEVFGKGNVYKNVQVVKKKGEPVTDIDVLAVYGNKAVIVQAKSKKLTELSKKGDEQQLRNDFKEAIQKAYSQGLVCRSAVIDKSNQLLDAEGRLLTLEESIDDAYIICLSTEHYPAVASQLMAYLEKKSQDPFPLALSVFDLDILSFYLNDPFDFLYYLRQRVALTEKVFAASEITVLAYHLNQKLILPPSEKANMLAIDEQFAQLIDANFPAMRGRHPKSKANERLLNKWKNGKFHELLSKLKSSKVPQFMDAIFFLLDLSSESADNLVGAIERTKLSTLRDKKNHDFTMELGDAKKGISFVASYGAPEKLRLRLINHAAARKYKSKADEWIALGWVFGSENIIDAAVYNKEPWEEDEQLEKLSKVLLTTGILRNNTGGKIGRNDPCPCGVGVKYKKCHGK